MPYPLIERGTGRLRLKLPLHAMRFAVLILPFITVLAFGQEPRLDSLRIETISTETPKGEVRVNIDTSGVLESPGSVVAADNKLIWNLRGVAYERSGQRLVVNQNGVRDLVVSTLRQDPPLTRITIRVSRPGSYALSSNGKR